MDADDTFRTIAEIIGQTFKVPAADVLRTTEAADVHGWDSLAHATVLLAIERAFTVRLPVRRAYAAANVGALCDLVAEIRATC